MVYTDHIEVNGYPSEPLPRSLESFANRAIALRALSHNSAIYHIIQHVKLRKNVGVCRMWDDDSIGMYTYMDM